jgi:DNA invertase Pin-like site-specific DNA recombinase
MSEQVSARYVCYYRVSTQRQGQSGLGLEAQHEAVKRYIATRAGIVVAEFTETESGKKANNRPELMRALDLCRKQKVTLAIAKLDRLARNVHFISGLLETGVDFVAVDQPMKDRFMLHVQAAFAEEEARRISVRTKEALAAAKKRGVVLGITGAVRARRLQREAILRAKALAPVLAEIHAAGFTRVRQIRDELNQRGVPSPGGGRWHLPTTHRTLLRLRRHEGRG